MKKLKIICKTYSFWNVEDLTVPFPTLELLFCIVQLHGHARPLL